MLLMGLRLSEGLDLGRLAAVGGVRPSRMSSTSFRGSSCSSASRSVSLPWPASTRSRPASVPGLRRLRASRQAGRIPCHGAWPLHP